MAKKKQNHQEPPIGHIRLVCPDCKSFVVVPQKQIDTFRDAAKGSFGKCGNCLMGKVKFVDLVVAKDDSE